MKTIELANQTTTTYAGSYSYYVKVRDQRRAALETAYAKQQEHIKATEEYIRKYKAGIKAKQARGRQSQLDRLERIILPPAARTFDFFTFQPPPNAPSGSLKRKISPLATTLTIPC